MQASLSVDRVLMRAMAVAGALIATSSAFAAKPSVPAIVVSNVALDKSSIQAGQTVQVSYTLNEASSSAGVLIELLSGTTVAKTVTFLPPAPETGAGAHTVLFDTNGLGNGTYSVRVSAPNGGTSQFVNVTDMTNPLLHFSNPRGVDVNKVTGSPAYGRIYVSEGSGGPVAGRDTVEGVYMINPDLTEPFPGNEPKVYDSGANGGAWAGSANSPFRVFVGPDSKVYITDWSDPHAGLFITDPDGNQVDDVFAWPNPDGGQRSSGGLTTDSLGNAIYGSISSVWVEGTGANRKITATEEDLTGPNGTDANVWEYALPDGQVHAAPVPVLKVENWDAAASKGYFGYTYQDVVKDSQGNYFVTDTDEGSLINEAYKFSPTGALIKKLPETGATYYGIAIDESRNRIALAADGGRVFLTDKTFQAVSLLATLGSGRTRDVAFDGEGWLYALNSSVEQLFLLAPPGTPVTGGSATATGTLTVVSPVPGDVAPVGTGGLFTGPNGHKYGDGKVDIADAVAVLRIAAGLQPVP